MGGHRSGFDVTFFGRSDRRDQRLLENSFAAHEAVVWPIQVLNLFRPIHLIYDVSQRDGYFCYAAG
jgi:hypothetical protein